MFYTTKSIALYCPLFCASPLCPHSDAPPSSTFWPLLFSTLFLSSSHPSFNFFLTLSTECCVELHNCTAKFYSIPQHASDFDKKILNVIIMRLLCCLFSSILLSHPSLFTLFSMLPLCVCVCVCVCACVQISSSAGGSGSQPVRPIEQKDTWTRTSTVIAHSSPTSTSCLCYSWPCWCESWRGWWRSDTGRRRGADFLSIRIMKKMRKLGRRKKWKYNR